MKKVIVLIIAIFMISIANAQWVNTSLDSSLVFAIATNDSIIYAGGMNWTGTTVIKSMYLSTNNGNTWTSIITGLPDTTYVETIAISGNNVFIGTSKGVYLTTNNGSIWSLASTGLPNYNVNSLAISGTNIFAGTSGGGVYMSTNNGNNWTAVNTGLTNLNVASLATNGNFIIAGTDGGGVFMSTNSGSSWAAVNIGLTNLKVYSLAISGNKIFAGTWGGGVYISTNNGNNWTATNTGLVDSNYVFTFAIDGNNIFTTTQWGNVSFSSNNGASWAATNEGIIDDSVESLAINANYIFTGGERGVWRRPLSDFPSGIEENTLNNISLYPNPTKDNITIETSSNNEQKIEIINLLGQTIYTIYINKKATINTSAFANGLYILKLSSDKETVVRKFVKE